MELAARIGQKLLADNQTLRNRNEYLEEQLLQATDKVVIVRAAMVIILWVFSKYLSAQFLPTYHLLRNTVLDIFYFFYLFFLST